MTAQVPGDTPTSPAVGCRSPETDEHTEVGDLVMAALAAVIPLKPYQKNRLVPPAEPRIPEPAKLYCLAVLALMLHAPVTDGGICGQCSQDWPCPQVRLAYRLREGF